MTTVKPMNQTEFSKAIDALGLTQVSAARFLGVDPRTCRRYVAGTASRRTTSASSMGDQTAAGISLRYLR